VCEDPRKYHGDAKQSPAQQADDLFLVQTMLDPPTACERQSQLSQLPPNYNFFFEVQHHWAWYYCLEEMDGMQDKGLPALPFDASMRNIETRVGCDTGATSV
jgi:hypothetical protein